jgi:hypothetical protein
MWPAEYNYVRSTMGDGPPGILIYDPRQEPDPEDRELNPMIYRQLHTWRKLGGLLAAWIVLHIVLSLTTTHLPADFMYGIAAISAAMCGVALSMITLCALEPGLEQPPGTKEWQPKTSGIFLSALHLFMPATFLAAAICSGS